MSTEDKKCSSCKKHKSFLAFYPDKHTLSGFSAYCIKCSAEKALTRSRSIDGLINVTYQAQKKSSTKRNHGLVSYSKKALKEWAITQDNFYTLYAAWVLSGYSKMLRPSVDRKDDYKGYSFDNIRLTTWEDNLRKAHRDRKSGINTKHNKAVTMLDLSGNKLQEFHSMGEASRSSGVPDSNISNVCKGKRKSAGGKLWVYA